MLSVIASLVKQQLQIANCFRVVRLLNVFTFFNPFDPAIDQAAAIASPIGEGDEQDENDQCANLNCGHVVCSMSCRWLVVAAFRL
ncbi:hypothetical protein D3C72_2125830 [compost metagenome]